MTAAEILEQVTRIVAETVGLDDLALVPSMTAADVEGWDSLAHVQIIVGIERAFDLRFRTGEIATIKNVGELVERIGARMSASRAR